MVVIDIVIYSNTRIAQMGVSVKRVKGKQWLQKIKDINIFQDERIFLFYPTLVLRTVLS